MDECALQQTEVATDLICVDCGRPLVTPYPDITDAYFCRHCGWRIKGEFKPAANGEYARRMKSLRKALILSMLSPAIDWRDSVSLLSAWLKGLPHQRLVKKPATNGGAK